jgi:undecaprenyl-diphosphatase
MNWWQAVSLSLLQGLTEFLPVSSSGHLVIFQKIFGLQPPVLFDVFVHVGTLGSVIFFFRKELLKILQGLLKKDKNAWHIFWLVVVGSLPAIVVGLFLEKNINQIFNSIRLVGISFLMTSVLLISTRWFKNKNNKRFKSLNWHDALIIGFFQALAILPGVSRSGSTLVGGLSRKIKREIAFQFSFFLALPAISGALVLQIPDLINQQFDFLSKSIFGLLIAGLVGYFSLKILKNFLLNSRLWFFGFYCFFLALLIFFFS